MKLPKRIAQLLTVTLVVSSVGNLGYTDTIQRVFDNKLVGAGRWETAIEVSKIGWTQATEAIIVNDNAIADALAATPFAEAKNAPILLTGKDKLDERTSEELKRLGVKKVYLIGGEAVLSKSIEEQLKNQKFEIDRIHGATRELTALEIANRLNKIKKITEIAVVNGTTGLSDAVSIAATAAKKDMAIILSNPSEGTKASDEFIKNNNIKTSYVIGGPNAISKEVEGKLPNAKRIEGIDRNETNAKVLETFYTEKELKNAYVAKDGMGKEDQLIDALTVGVLAAKNDSPVIIVGNKLNEMQKDVTNTKSFEAVTQVGGNGNETAFNELKTMQGVTTYEVKTVAELNDALAKADANDVINVRSLEDKARSNKIEISSKNKVQINLHATSGKSVVVNVKSGSLTAHGSHTSIDIKGGDLVINGSVESINVLDGGEVTVSNKGTSKPNINVAEGASVEVAGSINTITVSGKDAQVNVAEGSTVSKVEVSENASGTVIENNGKVDNVVSNAPNVNIENSGTVGEVTGSGSNKPTIDNTQGGTVNKPSNGGTSGGGTSSGGVVQNPTVSGVSVTTDGDNVTVIATAKNYGSKKARVELLKETTVVKSEESVNIESGEVSYTFKGVENGTYTVKVTVGAANSTSQTFILNAWDGTTTEVVQNDGVYEINTPGELAYIAQIVNEGSTNISIKLMNDIDLSNKEWTPIGISKERAFAGTFDGNNKTIKNLSITSEDGEYIGLFGYGNRGVELKNINIEKVNITGKQNIGSLIGYIFGDGKINNCNITNAKVTATLKDVGGIIGAGYVDILDCNLEDLIVKAERVEDEGDNVGSAIGYLADGEHKVSNVKANNVTLSGERKVGGIAGSANHSGIIFENCQISGDSSIDVTDSKASSSFAGGILGESVKENLTIKNCIVDKDTVKILGDNKNLLGWFVGGAGERDGSPVEVGEINFVDDENAGCTFENNRLDWDGITLANAKQINGVYHVSTASQLAGIAKFVNDGNANISIKLMADIDLNNKEWTPIGISEERAFAGTFNGNGKTITNLSINKPNTDYLGLFGYAKNAMLKNVTIDKIDIKGNRYLGALIGRIISSRNTTSTVDISNCKVNNAVINGSKMIGGIAGYGAVDIESCTVDKLMATANDQSGEDGDDVGGIVGYIPKGAYNISDSTVSNVKLKGLREVGGIAGSANGSGSKFLRCSVNDINSIAIIGTIADTEIDKGNAPCAGGILGKATDNGNVIIEECQVECNNLTIEGKIDIKKGWLIGMVESRNDAFNSKNVINNKPNETVNNTGLIGEVINVGN